MVKNRTQTILIISRFKAKKYLLKEFEKNCNHNDMKMTKLYINVDRDCKIFTYLIKIIQ